MKIAVIVGSTRTGRNTPKIAKWVRKEAEAAGYEADLLDLADFEMPFFNESMSPQFNQNRQPEGDVKEWLEALG